MSRPVSRPAQPRNSGLAQIHIAKKDLAMADDTYRHVLWAVARVKSSKDLDHAGRAKVLAHFKACGWTPKPPKNAAPPRQGPLPMPRAPRPELQRSAADPSDKRWMQARRLWAKLAASGAVQFDTDGAMGEWVSRQTKAEHWRFLNGHQVNGVIESLKRWCARLNIDPQH